MGEAKHRGRITLVLGGARSGKSGFAEERVLARGGDAVYLATAEAWDEEMRARVDEHRRRRAGAGWRTVEEPLKLSEAIAEHARPGRAVLVDCLTLWLTNQMLAGNDVDAATDGLLAALTGADGDIVLVANEVGYGIVPETPLGRRFRDHAGRLNQRIAALADEVVLVVAGIPLTVKSAD